MFKKGQEKPKGSGMKQGQKTTKTILLYNFIESVINNDKVKKRLENILTDGTKLNDKDFVNAFIKLTDFVIPKQTRLETVQDNDNELHIEYTVVCKTIEEVREWENKDLNKMFELK